MKFIDCIKKFNRKERYFLVKYAMSGEKDGSKDEGFKLADNFKNALDVCLKEALGSIKIPANAYAAMDYHLDWIYASLELAFGNKKFDLAYPRDVACISATQEDIDFIIVFEDSQEKGIYHIILIEAKADNSWSNSQMKSKCEKRFPAIFGQDKPWYGKVKPYLILMSPGHPRRLKYDIWEQWMKKDDQSPYYIQLPYPLKQYYVTQCLDDDKNTPAQKDKFWKITE
jgi:hypothetical protein